MRDFLMRIWRKITTIKVLHPLVIFIRWFAGTDFFNTVLDFAETNVFNTDYSKTMKFYKDNQEDIRNIIGILADVRSKSVYDKIWKYRCTHNRKYMRGITDKDQYFDCLVKLEDNEVFVDCGAYRGDTIERFIKHMRHHIVCKIFAFEPDKYNYSILEKYVATNNLKEKIICINKGTWNEASTVGFEGDTEEGCKITGWGGQHNYCYNYN